MTINDEVRLQVAEHIRISCRRTTSVFIGTSLGMAGCPKAFIFQTHAGNRPLVETKDTLGRAMGARRRVVRAVGGGRRH